ncbi:MAG TPA: hypothetical protein VEX36_04010 [Thermoleophilaceae bacterium]|nr:hypothetical protein [Thermoleophilaceae bacterium]
MRRSTISSSRLLAFALAFALAGGIVACGDSGDESDGSPRQATGASRDDTSTPSTGADRPADGASEKERISATVRGMYDDFAAGNAKGVCAALSVDARRSVAINVIGGSTEPAERRTCEESLAKFVDAAAGSGLLERTGAIDVGGITISDGLATVVVSTGDRSGKVGLVKENGDWRLDAAPGTPGTPGSPRASAGSGP